METDWTGWTPPPRDLPELDAETLAAVRALQGGETEGSTRHLCKTYKPQLLAYFKRQSCQKLDADDLTQTVFIQMLEQIAGLKDPARFRFWLFRIARNALRNHLRDSARDREALEDFADLARKDSESGTFWVRGTFEPSPEANLTVGEAVDRRRLVFGKLLQVTRLGPMTRRSLLLRLSGDSCKEIARALGLPGGTVRSHLSRASAALTRNLEKIDLDELEAEQPDDDVAELSAELLTFKREALEADPAYFRAGVLEAASADYEMAEESEEAPVRLARKEDSGGDDETDEVERVVDSPAAGRRDAETDLGRLERDDLAFALMLLDEVAARCGGLDGHADGRLALRGKLTCAGALLARGRRFGVARRAEEAVRLAILLIGNGRWDASRYDASRRDEIHHQVVEGRRLLRSYLGRNEGGPAPRRGDENHVSP